MLVAFDCDKMTYASLLGKVHTHGYTAQLVGG